MKQAVKDRAGSRDVSEQFAPFLQWVGRNVVAKKNTPAASPALFRVASMVYTGFRV